MCRPARHVDSWNGQYVTGSWTVYVKLYKDGDDYMLALTVTGDPSDYSVEWRLSDGDFVPPCPQANDPGDWVLESNDVPNSSTPSMSLSYAGPASTINDRLNRVEAIKDGSTVLAAYTYLGL